MILYHGSDKLFDHFRLSTSRRGSAVFLTEDPMDARSYGKFVYTVELPNSAKLFEFGNSQHIAALDAWVTRLLAKQKPYDRNAVSFYPYEWDQVLRGIKEGAWHHFTNQIVTKYIKAHFDGWYEREGGRTQIAITNTRVIQILGVQEYPEGQYPGMAQRRVVARYLSSDESLSKSRF
jgi:hypothetical protein